MIPILLALSTFSFTRFQEQSGPLFEEKLLPGVRTTCGAREKNYILEVNGPGLCVADFDGDGAPDLVLVDGSTLERVEAGQPGLPPRLFLGRGDGGFREAGKTWEIPGGRWGTGAASADFDGDGDTDLVVLEWGRDRLFENVEARGFREVEESGFDGRRWGTSGAFLDADGDGFLELAVVNYLAFAAERVASRETGRCRWKGHPVLCGPEGLVPVHDQLYRNVEGKRFEEVSLATGFRPERAGFGLGVLTSDMDVDGDTDLYITNDSTPNHLWENCRSTGDELSWREIGLRAGVALDASGKEQAGMGIACGDLNLDGLDDYFISNFSGESNALYLSLRVGRWRDRAAPAGLARGSLTRLGWGAMCEDFDLDGDLDLAVLNGHVYPEADAPGTDSSFKEQDVLLQNLGLRGPKKRLGFLAQPLSDAAPGVSRAGVAVDLDRDGRPDIVALELDGGVRLLRNCGEGEGHWLIVRLSGQGANTQGIGARVRLEWDGGYQEREMRTSGGFQSSVPAEIHFGLGPVEVLQRIRVRWPSGRRSEHTDVELDRVLSIVEPEEGGKGR